MLASAARHGHHRGATLVELVISIVVISVAVTGVMLAMSQTTRRSADPVIQQQAVAIAEAYFEEIALLAFDEVAATGGSESGGAETGETRATYDDLNDYNGHSDVGPRGLDNPAVVIAGLDDYTVNVDVTNAGGLGPGGAQVGGLDALRIDVTVTHPLGVNVTLSGFRTRY